ncbi:MAG: VWA domain-containing protein [Bryobacteraceae bacterium]
MTRRELLFLAAAPPCAAQFSSSVRVVNVFVTVRNKKGELVRGLKREDFELREDGRNQPIRYFSAESDLPLTLGILFDVSGSQRSVLERQKGAAKTFLGKLFRPGDTAFFVAFDRDVTMLDTKGFEVLTTDRSGSRGTALFDALSQAAERVKDEPGRKALIVLSDGIDTASAVKADATITALQRANTIVIPVHFYDRDVFAFEVPSPALDNLRNGKRVLERIAKETGGGFYQVSGEQTLEDSFERIQEELRYQYSLGYSPGAGRPGFRKLRVQTKLRGLTVQARDGYFAAE